MNYDIEWKYVNCGGDEVDYDEFKGLIKSECKAKCDSAQNCSFVVYNAADEVKNSNASCVSGSKINLPCTIDTSIQTYIKKGNFLK